MGPLWGLPLGGRVGPIEVPLQPGHSYAGRKRETCVCSRSHHHRSHPRLCQWWDLMGETMFYPNPPHCLQMGFSGGPDSGMDPEPLATMEKLKRDQLGRAEVCW